MVARLRHPATPTPPDADSLALLAEHGADMISVHAIDGTFLSVGGAFTRVLGWRPEDLLGRSAWEFMHPAERDHVRQADQRLRVHGKGHVEYRFRHADGSWCWVEARTLLTPADDGPPRIVCITRDIGERRGAEQALRETYALLTALVEGTTDHVFVKTLDGRYALINQAGASFMQRRVDEILGRTDRELFPADVAERIAERDRAVIERGETITFETETHVDGEPHVFSGTKGPMRDAAGTITGLFAIMREITEQKNAERKLREQAEELRALSLVDELTGLYNRRGFTTLAQQQLATARRLGKKLVLLFADLDGLKPINDQFGHEAGDRAIVAAAGLLRACFRESDVIGRMGGDEFAVAAMEISPGSGASFAGRLDHALATYNERSPEHWEVSFSVGMVEFDPAHPHSLDELLRQADEQMYARKRARRRAR